MHLLTPTSLARFVSSQHKKSISILTGAGVSTESGLPDYRGPHGLYSSTTNNTTTSSRLIHHGEYIDNEMLRKRYWLRSLAGFSLFQEAKPNRTHESLVHLEEQGIVSGIVTQNVDRLHHVAGSRNVIELHGRGDLVQCMKCGHEVLRRDYVQDIQQRNERWLDKLKQRGLVVKEIRPDFDSRVSEEWLSEEILKGMELPECRKCQYNVMKPSFVFFGGSVSSDVANKAKELLFGSPVLLVVGTTVHTYSAFRPVSLARTSGKVSMGIVNRGETRVDHLADLGIYSKGSCGDFFEELVGLLIH